MNWEIVFTSYAQKDAKKIARSGLKKKVIKLLDIIKNDSCQTPLPYKKLVGDLRGAFSRRINIQHRLVYEVLEKERTVKVLRMWSHYE